MLLNMFSQNNEKRKRATQYDSHFWDKLVKILFISGLVIFLLTVVTKWLGFLD